MPRGVAYDSIHNRVFVGDRGNNRVLVFSGATLSNGMNANTVLGQANFTSATAATTQAGMSSPFGLAYDNTNDRLFVAGLGNNRVTVFNLSSGLTTGMNASNVLGQATFTSSTAAATQSGMNGPVQPFYDATTSRLFVGDDNNNRVLVFDLSSGVTNGMNASYVLGQPNFTSTTEATTQAGIRFPEGIGFDSLRHRLFIGDDFNNRVLVFNVSNISNGMRASNVLGQSDFTSSGAATTQTGMSQPKEIAYDGTNDRAIVADSANNRLLVFDASPTAAALSLSTPAIGGNASVTLTDLYRNTTSAADTAVIALTDEDGDTEALTLTETGTGTGIFTGTMPVVHGTVIRGNGKLENSGHTSFRISGTYTDVYGSTVTAASAVITDGGGTGDSGGGGGGGGGGRRILPSSSSSSNSVGSQSSASSVSSSLASSSRSSAPSSGFSDVPASSWFARFVADLSARGIVSGYKDGQGRLTGLFGPGNPVTEAEALKMALLAGGKGVAADGVPKNTSAQGDWSARYVAEAETLGLTVFSPSLDVRRPATRGEVIETLLEVLGIPTDQTTANPFSDLRSDDPFAGAILTAWMIGLITGDTDAQGKPTGAVRANDPINRAEAAKIVALALAMEGK